MAASLSSSSPLFIAAGALDNSDDLATTIFVLLLVLTPFVLLTVTLWNRRSTQSELPARAARLRTKPTAGEKRAPVRANSVPTPVTSVVRIVPSASRRIISLHSTTPGQSPFEYNIGDNQGTRGSALVRAA